MALKCGVRTQCCKRHRSAPSSEDQDRNDDCEDNVTICYAVTSDGHEDLRYGAVEELTASASFRQITQLKRLTQ